MKGAERAKRERKGSGNEKRAEEKVYYLLCTVYYLLSTVYCLLSNVYCLLSTVKKPALIPLFLVKILENGGNGMRAEKGADLQA